jgi:hypothetical protein
MSDVKYRTISLYKNYFFDFFKISKAKGKRQNFMDSKIIETQKSIPSTYLKHIEGTDG